MGVVSTNSEIASALGVAGFGTLYPALAQDHDATIAVDAVALVAASLGGAALLAATSPLSATREDARHAALGIRRELHVGSVGCRIGCRGHPEPGATWGGVALSVAALGLLGGLLVWSRRSGRGRAHVLLVAAGSLMATVAASFFVGDPLGDASPAERYLSNTILLVGVVALLVWAWRQTRRAYPGVAAAACLQNERS